MQGQKHTGTYPGAYFYTVMIIKGTVPHLYLASQRKGCRKIVINEHVYMYIMKNKRFFYIYKLKFNHWDLKFQFTNWNILVMTAQTIEGFPRQSSYLSHIG